MSELFTEYTKFGPMLNLTNDEKQGPQGPNITSRIRHVNSLKEITNVIIFCLNMTLLVSLMNFILALTHTPLSLVFFSSLKLHFSFT